MDITLAYWIEALAHTSRICFPLRTARTLVCGLTRIARIGIENLCFVERKIILPIQLFAF